MRRPSAGVTFGGVTEAHLYGADVRGDRSQAGSAATKRSATSVGGARAGRVPGTSVGSARCPRMRATTAGWSTTAINRSRPPQRGQVSTSRARLRRAGPGAPPAPRRRWRNPRSAARPSRPRRRRHVAPGQSAGRLPSWRGSHRCRRRRATGWDGKRTASPSLANTPSMTSTWKWMFMLSAPPNRCTMVTAPPRSSRTPASRARPCGVRRNSGTARGSCRRTGRAGRSRTRRSGTARTPHEGAALQKLVDLLLHDAPPGRPSPSRRSAACARNASKWLRTTCDRNQEWQYPLRNDEGNVLAPTRIRHHRAREHSVRLSPPQLRTRSSMAHRVQQHIHPK